MDERKHPLTDEQVQAEIGRIRITGYVYALFVVIVGLGLAYALWPAGITDSPLSSIAIGQLLRALGSIAVGFVAVALGIYECVDSASYRG